MQSDSDPSYFRLVQMQNEMIKQHYLVVNYVPRHVEICPQLKVEAVCRHPPTYSRPCRL